MPCLRSSPSPIVLDEGKASLSESDLSAEILNSNIGLLSSRGVFDPTPESVCFHHVSRNFPVPVIPPFPFKPYFFSRCSD